MLVFSSIIVYFCGRFGRIYSIKSKFTGFYLNKYYGMAYCAIGAFIIILCVYLVSTKDMFDVLQVVAGIIALLALFFWLNELLAYIPKF